MRFCTSPSGVTIISSTRFSERRMNSICRKTWARLGASTTPANWLRFDNNVAAALMARLGSAAGNISRISLGCNTSNRCTANSLSTNMRYPRGVGTRPAEVWGLCISPSSSRSAMTLRMVAGDRSNIFDSVREPTGCPSAMYFSISAFSSAFALSSMRLFYAMLPTQVFIPTAIRSQGQYNQSDCIIPSIDKVFASMHFKTVAIIGRYQDTGLDAPLRKLAAMLQTQGCQVLVEAETARNTSITEYTVASYEQIGQQAD